MDVRTSGVFIVTGGAGAVAGSIARLFREAGARLALVDLDEAAVRRRAEPLGALALAADLTAETAAGRVVAQTMAEYGRLDGLIHTAGGFRMAPAHEADAALYDRMLDINMRTLFLAVRAVLPPLIAQQSGFIAGFSAGLVVAGGGAGMTAYAAAKGAVSHYLRALETEVRPHGIRVAIVYPLGAIDTPQNRRDMPRVDPETWIDPDEIGRVLLFSATRSRRGRLTELVVGAA